jgi:hypothetical protein
VVLREICAILTKGTRTYCHFDDLSSLEDFESGRDGDNGCASSLLLCIKELVGQDPKAPEYGICAVDSIIGKVTLGRCQDDALSYPLDILILDPLLGDSGAIPRRRPGTDPSHQSAPKKLTRMPLTCRNLTRTCHNLTRTRKCWSSMGTAPPKRSERSACCAPGAPSRSCAGGSCPSTRTRYETHRLPAFVFFFRIRPCLLCVCLSHRRTALPCAALTGSNFTPELSQFNRDFNLIARL